MLAFPVLHAGDRMNTSKTKGPAAECLHGGGRRPPRGLQPLLEVLLPSSGSNWSHEAENLANCTSEPTSTAPHCQQVTRPAVPDWAPALQRAVREAGP